MIEITKDIANKIENERKAWTDDTILIQHTERTMLNESNPELNPLDKLHFTDLAKALYGGYEIKKKENLINMSLRRFLNNLETDLEEDGDTGVNLEMSVKEYLALLDSYSD